MNPWDRDKKLGQVLCYKKPLTVAVVSDSAWLVILKIFGMLKRAELKPSDVLKILRINQNPNLHILPIIQPQNSHVLVT